MGASNGIVLAEIIASTAAATLVITVIFFFIYRFLVARRHPKDKGDGSFRREEVRMTTTREDQLRQCGGNVKGLIVDENGVDVVYSRKLELGGQVQTHFPKVVFNPSYESQEEDAVEEKRVDTTGDSAPKMPKLQAVHSLPKASDLISCGRFSKPFAQNPAPEVVLAMPTLQPPTLPFRITPPKKLKTEAQESLPSLPPSPAKIIPALSQPPPPLLVPPPPPPPPPPQRPRIVRRKSIPFNPPRQGGASLAPKPPPAPKGMPSKKAKPEASAGESSKDSIGCQMKLKPLHWDKVMAAAVDHSMVWDQITDGSFRFDDELMENLFGYNITKNQTNERSNNLSSLSKSTSAPAAQVFILDPRKSQNTAIVLKSLTISRKEIIDALRDGHGLGSETLEKLTKISPTKEEEIKILQFNGNPCKLADAESFLYHILKAVPLAFTRFNAMLFRANYDPEIIHLKQSLQTLELGCKELRSRGFFLKLLEAILKAGNRMNAGTARGNAQGFDLNTLLKLSDVKSTDAKTTLLHFVVEQVAQSEGRDIVINHRNKTDSSNLDHPTAEEKRTEYLIHGLPKLGSLSSELSNVKKAAAIDYDSFIRMSITLTSRVDEIRKVLTQCCRGETAGGFAREMKGFLEQCEDELKVVREEQTRVMELVKKTTEYYQAGAAKDKGAQPLQLFVIVKGFLDMVDLVCAEISRKLQRRSTSTATAGSASPPLSPVLTPKKLQNFHSHFSSPMHWTSSSDSE